MSRLTPLASRVVTRTCEVMKEHLESLAKLFRENQIDYALHDTSEPLDFALFDFLSARERLSRVR